MKNLEKMLQQIAAVVKVEETRTFFREVLGIGNACIGGSAALLLHHDIYLERPVHDIDVILDECTFVCVHGFLARLSRYFEIELKEGSSYYNSKKGYKCTKSYSIVLKTGTEINVLVGKHPEGEWQTLEEIVKAKKDYNRAKDHKDLAIIFG